MKITNLETLTQVLNNTTTDFICPQSEIIHNQKKIFKKEVVYGGIKSLFLVKVRYDDNCKNGHNSFSITGEIWTKRKYEEYKKGNKSVDCEICGCIHDEIKKYFPELAYLTEIHHLNIDGGLHYIANTIYHAEDNNLMAARSTAYWNNATLEQLKNEKVLKNRIPVLQEALYKVVTNDLFNFIY